MSVIRRTIIAVFMFAILNASPILSQDGAAVPTGATVHMVVEIDGTAQIRRSSWSAPDAIDNLAVGDLVSNDDRIIPVGLATVLILCSDQITIVTIREFESSPTCGGLPGDPISVMVPHPRLSASTVVPRGPGETMIVTPRSVILSATPTIRWTLAEGAASYAVSIIRNADSATLWLIDRITGSTLPYPADRPPLTPGVYSIFVEPRNDQNRPLNDGMAQLITLADPASIALSTNGVQPPALVSDDVRSYLIALDYARNLYFSDAIMTLESALGIDLNSDNYAPIRAQMLVNSPQALLDLGGWYSQLGLAEFAKEAYQMALDIAQINAYQNNAALAQYGLAQFESTGEKQLCYYQSSREFFIRVGLTQSIVEQLFKDIIGIETPVASRASC